MRRVAGDQARKIGGVTDFDQQALRDHQLVRAFAGSIEFAQMPLGIVERCMDGMTAIKTQTLALRGFTGVAGVGTTCHGALLACVWHCEQPARSMDGG